MSHNELACICCCLNGGLFLGISVNRSLVHKVEDACNGMTCKHVVIQVGIDIVSESHISSKGYWFVLGMSSDTSPYTNLVQSYPSSGTSE